jgi:hypothetical protein
VESSIHGSAGRVALPRVKETPASPALAVLAARKAERAAGVRKSVVAMVGQLNRQGVVVNWWLGKRVEAEMFCCEKRLRSNLNSTSQLTTKLRFAIRFAAESSSNGFLRGLLSPDEHCLLTPCCSPFSSVRRFLANNSSLFSYISIEAIPAISNKNHPLPYHPAESTPPWHHRVLPSTYPTVRI